MNKSELLAALQEIRESMSRNQGFRLIDNLIFNLEQEPEPKVLARGWTAKGIQDFGDWDFVSEGKHWLVSEEQEYKDDAPVAIIEGEGP